MAVLTASKEFPERGGTLGHGAGGWDGECVGGGEWRREGGAMDLGWVNAGLSC